MAKEIKTVCVNPKCDDTSSHLWINIERGVFHCWKCDWSGKINSSEKVLRFLKNRGVKDKDEKRKEEKENKNLYDNEYMDLKILPKTHMAIKYLKKRDLTIDLCKQVGGSYCHRGFLSGRIVFPVRIGETIVCLQGRTVYGRNPKYLTLGKKKLALFGTKLLSEYEDFVILLEGIFDALKIPDCGVAILGKMISPEQVRILSTLLMVRKIFVMFDADAKPYTEAAVNRLRSFFQVTPVYLGKGDPGDLTKEQIMELCKNV